jgi:hypothetical protein
MWSRLSTGSRRGKCHSSRLRGHPRNRGCTLRVTTTTMVRPHERSSAGTASGRVPGHVVLLAAALATMLASCTGTPSVQTPSGSPRSTPSPPAPSIAPSARPSPSPTETPTAQPSAPIPANEPTCTGPQLQIAYWPALSGGAAGNAAISLAVWNRGAKPCKLRGWATLQFLNTAGGLVPTHWVETTSTFSGSARDVAVSLIPCAQPNRCAADAAPAAYINFSGDDVIEPCEVADSVRVITPGSSTPVIVNLRVDGFPDGQTFCSAGKIFVLPIQSSLAVLGPTLSDCRLLEPLRRRRRADGPASALGLGELTIVADCVIRCPAGSAATLASRGCAGTP